MSVSSPFCAGHCHPLAGAWLPETDQHGLLGGARVCWGSSDPPQCFSNLNMHTNCLAHSESVGWGRGPRFCISKKFLGEPLPQTLSSKGLEHTAPCFWFSGVPSLDCF